MTRVSDLVTKPVDFMVDPFRRAVRPFLRDTGLLPHAERAVRWLNERLTR